MDVTIRVQPDAALALHGQRAATSESDEVLHAARDLGVRLKPLHPGATDPYLAPYFTVAVPDLAAAARVLDRLRGCPAVEAAYVKPPDAMP